jgi:hypothetical protein
MEIEEFDLNDLKKIIKDIEEIKAYIAYQQEKEARTYTRLLQSQPAAKPVSVNVTIDGKLYTCIGEVLYNEYEEICGTKRKEECILFKAQTESEGMDPYP